MHIIKASIPYPQVARPEALAVHNMPFPGDDLLGILSSRFFPARRAWTNLSRGQRPRTHRHIPSAL